MNNINKQKNECDHYWFCNQFVQPWLHLLHMQNSSGNCTTIRRIVKEQEKKSEIRMHGYWVSLAYLKATLKVLVYHGNIVTSSWRGALTWVSIMLIGVSLSDSWFKKFPVRMYNQQHAHNKGNISTKYKCIL